MIAETVEDSLSSLIYRDSITGAVLFYRDSVQKGEEKYNWTSRAENYFCEQLYISYRE